MLRPSILLVEDDEATRSQLAWALRDEFHLLTAEDAVSAVALAREQRPLVTVLDLGLPPDPTDPEQGLRVLGQIRRHGGSGRVIVCTGHGQREHGARAVEQGAHDFLTKPVDVDLLRVLVRRGCWLSTLEREQARLPPVVPDQGLGEMIGTSEAIRRVFTVIRKIAATDATVLITGESGTGKELAARLIHRLSPRAGGPFVAINCGAIPEALLESELFGHERGAFTGATQQRRGRLEYAQGGILFLDEIGELSPALQVKLLRFLQERTVERVGGRRPLVVDARIIAATNTDVNRTIADGTFRKDLYYRLGMIHLQIPPLRERGEDLLLLAQVFLRRMSREMGRSLDGLSEGALKAVQAHQWPGNVRELANRIGRAVLMAETPRISAQDLDLPPVGERGKRALVSLTDARRRAEREAIAEALVLYDGNLTRVAQGLRISRPALYARLRAYQIWPVERPRGGKGPGDGTRTSGRSIPS